MTINENSEGNAEWLWNSYYFELFNFHFLDFRELHKVIIFNSMTIMLYNIHQFPEILTGTGTAV